jgi:hypothetical protein
MALTPAQLAHYHEHGYAVGGRLLDDAALAALTTEVDALVAGREKHVGGSGGPLHLNPLDLFLRTYYFGRGAPHRVYGVF